MFVFFVVLFVVALAFELSVAFGLAGAPADWQIVGFAVGTALSRLILPALVVVPWQLLQKRSGRITRTPVMVGAIVFVLQYILLLSRALAPSI